MREQEIDLTKRLLKGLSPFPLNEPAQAGLVECFNFIPTEVGLSEHRALSALGWNIGYFNYLAIEDQLGELWYWYPIFDGHIVAGATVPSEPDTGLVATPVTTDPVQWVEILDENNQTWKLYPDTVAGWTRVTDTTPLTGVGLPALVWRGTTTESWVNKFDSVALTRHAVKVG